MISVIIPFFSNTNWLEIAVNSVLDQSIGQCEIIIVDDGSPEDLSTFLAKYSSIIIYKKIKNSGPGFARNVGISLAKGDYIAFLDSDDLWKTTKLESQFKFMTETGFMWSHTGYCLFSDFDGSIIREIDISSFHGDVFIRSFVSSPIATPCVMVKKEVFIENPEIRFSENMRFGQDGYLWIKIAEKYPLGSLCESLSMVRVRNNNASLRARNHLKVKADLWNNILVKGNLGGRCIPRPVSVAFFLASSFNQLRCKIETAGASEAQLEIISRFLYFPSFVILRFYNFILKF